MSADRLSDPFITDKHRSAATPCSFKCRYIAFGCMQKVFPNGRMESEGEETSKLY